MRPTRSLFLTLFTAVAAGALTTPSGGCGGPCDEYVECTTRPGLRYVQCSDERHEFNDGMTLEDANAAANYCYCSTAFVACHDGSELALCNFTGSDTGLGTIAVDKSGTSVDLASGVASCIGQSACSIETESCDFGGWYLDCGSRYVTADARVVNSEISALGSCLMSGTVDDDNGACVEAVSCSSLSSCEASTACWDDYNYECGTIALCSRNDGASACVADPACKWSPYSS